MYTIEFGISSSTDDTDKNSGTNIECEGVSETCNNTCVYVCVYSA